MRESFTFLERDILVGLQRRPLVFIKACRCAIAKRLQLFHTRSYHRPHLAKSSVAWTCGPVVYCSTVQPNVPAGAPLASLQ